ncbi:MAG: cytochrome c3 family protein [Pyrinomonadaceae bacterium]
MNRKGYRPLSRARTSYWCEMLAVTILLIAPIGVLNLDHGEVIGQRRRTPSPQQAARTRSVDYSKFFHSTKKHQQACNTCHKVPTRNWQTASDFPDVADYPNHDACVSCHRPQFFRGAKPLICTVCHVQVAPRADARFAFRKARSPSQFTTLFPHDKHQDVIALLWPTPKPLATFFIRVSFQSAEADDQTDVYNNCTICHGAPAALPKAPPSGWPDGFAPDALTFKSVPTDHGSCFKCHWKAQTPTRENCAGCHKLADVPLENIDLLSRISIKFRHEGGGERKNHVAECTTCHINITKAASLLGLKPDVPITSCTECHNKDGLRLDVSGELAQLDKNRDFVCVYCHTSNVGRLDPPASHYLIAGREPMTRKNLK